MKEVAISDLTKLKELIAYNISNDNTPRCRIIMVNVNEREQSEIVHVCKDISINLCRRLYLS